VKYSFLRQLASDFPVRVLCEVLGVSASGYYDWLDREPSATHKRRQALGDKIAVIHAAVKRRYGSPRMHQELLATNHTCSRNTVAKIMKSLGIQAISHRKFRVQTTDSNHGLPIAANHVAQEFTASRPNELWLSDMTYIPTQEGWLYLAVVEDLYSRRVVGWSMGPTMESRLVVDALAMAVRGRCPGAKLMAHSDRGGPYASEHYQRELAKHGITCSMSRRGNCYDNAPMESFFASLKKELCHHEDYATIEQAKASIFEYIEVFYNRQRRHSSLGYVAPAEFENSKNS
jgi:putative transposase